VNDYSKPIHQRSRLLMQEVSPSIRNPLVNLAKQDHSLTTTMRTLPATGNPALRSAEFLLHFPVECRVFDKLPIGQSRKVFNSHINANRIMICGEMLTFNLDNKLSKPTIHTAQNAELFDFTFH
jgi:hypothetical protein